MHPLWRNRKRGVCASSVATLLVAAALALWGCAEPGTRAGMPGSSAAPLSPQAEPPPPAINLSGFPLPYRQGYADGCASATGPERRDPQRFASDANYRTGWQDGAALCKKK